MANRGTIQPMDEQAASFLCRGELYQPATVFIERMALCQVSESRFDQLVIDRCRLARRKMDKKGANRRLLQGWLKSAAETLDLLQLRTSSWIERFVAPLGRRPKVGPKVSQSTACYRDIRLSTDPGLERRMEDVGADSLAAMDDVLDLTFEGPMEIDPVPPVLEDPLPVVSASSLPQRPIRKTASPIRVPAADKVSVGEDFIQPSRAKSKACNRPSRSTQRTSPRRRSPRKSVRSQSSTQSSAKVPSVPTRRSSPRKRPHSQSSGPVAKKSTLTVDESPSSRVVSSAPSNKGGILVEVSSPGPAPKNRSTRPRRCWIPDCPADVRYAKPHAFMCHLPGIVDERLPPASIAVLRGRKEALLQAAVWLLRRAVSDLEDLVEYVRMQHLLESEKVSISDSQIVAMRAFCGYLSTPCPDIFTMDPVNSIAVLTHWKVVLLIAARIPVVERDYWRSLYPIPEEVGIRTPRAFDAHFHFDRTLKAMGLPLNSTFEAVLDGTPMDKGKEIVVAGTCASYCDPETYPTRESLSTLPTDMAIAVGIHPKKRYNGSELDKVIRKLKELVRLPRVVAVGEFGLDHSVPVEFWHHQMVMLEKILPLVEPRHVVVLHCRGLAGDSGTEAYLLLLHFVKKAVPEDQRIYLHCFNGDSYVRDQWSSAFRNLYFGFTSMAAKFTPVQIRALKGINPERLFLETDAPYFNRPEHQWSAPNQLYWTAEAVAQHLNFKAVSLLNATVTNAQRLFQQ
ncbi:LOW QUALITY PROTEIN: uncharacterized protein [Argopecten irradians]|uniref:LOW QUALITY PROTEIN: uncharacterized protein n=1 Tax=Argopecten irradians TaxID=31199 RepID=UPI00371D2886